MKSIGKTKVQSRLIQHRGLLGEWNIGETMRRFAIGIPVIDKVAGDPLLKKNRLH
jgi:hypothetical protein